MNWDNVKTVALKKYLRELYRPSTLRDLKKGRDNWGNNEDIPDISNEINLPPDNIKDKNNNFIWFCCKK